MRRHLDDVLQKAQENSLMKVLDGYLNKTPIKLEEGSRGILEEVLWGLPTIFSGWFPEKNEKCLVSS